MTNDWDAKKQEAEGRVEEAAGDLTGRDDLRREGEVDEKTGKARQEMSEAADKAGEGLDEAAAKAKEAMGSGEGGSSGQGSSSGEGS